MTATTTRPRLTASALRPSSSPSSSQLGAVVNATPAPAQAPPPPPTKSEALPAAPIEPEPPRCCSLPFSHQSCLYGIGPFPACRATRDVRASCVDAC